MITEGIEMIIVVVWKNVLIFVAHAREVHVMRPDDEREETDAEVA